MSQAKPLLLSAAAKNTNQVFDRYILVHPRDAHLPHLHSARYCKTRKLNDHTSITFVDLTKQQAQELEGELAKINGSIQLNFERQLENPIKPLDSTQDELAVEAVNTYPSAPQTCSKITMRDDFILFFPDTLINKAKFPNANLSIGNNYSGSNKPCNPHSNYTFSVFEQVLGDPKLAAVNIPVFTCSGGSLTDAVTNGLMDILDYAKANPTKKVAMFFAVSGGMKNPAETAVVKELVAAGVMVGVSAGNNGANLCYKDIPPWNVPGVLQIGGTTPPGAQCPFFTNWSDVVPQSQFGDCVNAYLPSVFKIKQFNVAEKGTSFAVPQAVAWILRWWNENPNAKAAEAIQAFQNHTVTIEKAGESFYPPLTADGLIRVVETANYCNTNVSASKPRPT